ncbi:hypothetical protein BZA05DRAFT_82524 [Tricharina praecox]|uniref:uncharacterized protein n=1 Tax=Tricharina praecox TaxID=43433 RepID=UPI00221EDD4A|nr:uncharacterized protein BZA05DRAFT_82524 [Tricharina praecox]KAI5849088.1 hypothetical protein BZA05DRAFT_82524 [Tricharina praecox]
MLTVNSRVLYLSWRIILVIVRSFPLFQISRNKGLLLCRPSVPSNFDKEELSTYDRRRVLQSCSRNSGPHPPPPVNPVGRSTPLFPVPPSPPRCTTL